MWLAILLSLCLQGSSKIVQVQIVHRHGDRVPSVGYSIPNNWVDWSKPPPAGLGLGLGQLTGLGMSQAYNLGAWLRDTYISNAKLLSEDFRADDVSVYSTNVDRTLMTAQCVLMGLFPNGTSQSSYNDMDKRWGLPTGAQPIPIHTADKWDYIFQAVDICPEYNIRLTALYDSQEWKDKETEYKPFMDWFKGKTGFGWATLRDFYNFYDPVMVSKVHNKLTIQEVKDRFNEIQGVVDWVEWKKKSIGGKLIAAPLLGQIYVETERLMTTADTRKKYVQYSAHDSTLMALGVTAGYDSDAKFRGIAGYTSSFIFELNNDTSIPNPNGLSMVVKFRELSGAISTVATYKWQEWIWFIGNHTYPNTASWCLACNNTGVGGGYPGAGPCYRELEYFNYTEWDPDEEWEPPATPEPTVEPTAAPAPTESVPAPTEAPSRPPTAEGSTGVPTPALPPSTATVGEERLKNQLADVQLQLDEKAKKVDSQNLLIVVLSVVLGISILLALFLFIKLRQAKGTNLQGLQQYQGLN